MKEWEKKAREYHRLTLGKRFAYAAMGFVSVNLLGIIPWWFGVPLIGVELAALFFAAWGFLAGDKMIEFLSGIWTDWFDV